MTEAEWWAATGSREWPHRLFNWLFFIAGATDRKLRLSCVACCRFVEPFSGGAPFPHVLQEIEAWADGNEDGERVQSLITSIQSWNHQRWEALIRMDGHPTLKEEVEDHARHAILGAGCPYRDREWHSSRKKHPDPCYVAYDLGCAADSLGQQDAAERSTIHGIHDIFGPLPFRGVPVDPRWLT